jgi:hypothetical protein
LGAGLQAEEDVVVGALEHMHQITVDVLLGPVQLFDVILVGKGASDARLDLTSDHSGGASIVVVLTESSSSS